MSSEDKWFVKIDGPYADLAKIEQALGAPFEFRPGLAVPMPMAVVRSTPADVYLWRLHHWGLHQAPGIIRWGRDAIGNLVLRAFHSMGVPRPLFRTLAKEYPLAEFSLLWMSKAYGNGGELLTGHERDELPDWNKKLAFELADRAKSPPGSSPAWQ